MIGGAPFLKSLTALVQQLQQDVAELRCENTELRHENAELRRQVSELRCEVGYWKSLHARAVERNTKLQAKLDQATAEIRQLKAERFGKTSEKQSASDRSNDLVDPQQPTAPKKKRGQQPGRPAPKRRDYSHLPVREELIDLPEDDKVCACCGQPLAGLGHSEDREQIEIVPGQSSRRRLSIPSDPSAQNDRQRLLRNRFYLRLLYGRGNIGRRDP